jgi:UDP-N-acetylglucosamine 2-epimerase (non-hydrolysing)
VATGALRLVGTDPQAVYEGIAELLSTPALHAAMAAAENPFGDGCAATRIAKDLHRRLASGRV